MKKIVLVGGGGHCKVIIDIIRSTNEYEIVGVTERDIKITHVLDVPIIGDDSMLSDLYKSGVKYAFICVGALSNLDIRNKMYNSLKEIGYNIPVLIHKSATIATDVVIEEGTCVMPGVVTNPSVYIGKNCIINTSSVIEHDCLIGNNTHISPKAALGGGVKVGDNTHIGIGSSIIQGIRIGNNVTIGAGAVVINDIEDNALAVGVPAKVIKTKVTLL